MNLVSVNVGLPRLVAWQGATIKTGIFKQPAPGRVILRQTNLDGDRQADLSVHGGPNKAVYGYPSEHHAHWRRELPGVELPWGAFGENLTTAGLLETGVSMGDRYRIGSAVVKITTPRLPCFKLAAKFQREDIIARFLLSGRSGFYFSVVQEGEVGAGDEIQLVAKQENTLTIFELNHLYASGAPEPELLQRALTVAVLPESWRERFLAKLEAIGQSKTAV